MLFKNKIIARALLIAVAFVLALAGCGVAEDIGSLMHGRQQLAASSGVSSPLTSEETKDAQEQEAQTLREIRLYPAVGAQLGGNNDVLLQYANENHRRIFDSQVRYISDHEVTSTNIILPTGHTLYEDENGYFIFSGEEVVRVSPQLSSSLEDPSNPLYDTRGLMHDWLILNGDSLFDENGVLVTFDDASEFVPVSAQPLQYNNLILNAYDATEVLDSTNLSVSLWVFGVSTLADAKRLYDETEDKVVIRNRLYAPVIESDALTLYFNGTDGFLIDVHSYTLPRKETDQGTPGVMDYSELAVAAEQMYTQKLNTIGLAPRFEVQDIIAGKPITVYNPYSGKIEAVKPIDVDGDGKLSLSLDVLRILYGVQLMIDPNTETLHLYTDPLYMGLVQHLLGKSVDLQPVRYIDDTTADQTYLQQQEERAENNGYLTTLASDETEPSVPKPLIRTPRSGQFVYPGSNTKIWVSHYKGKGEPVSLRPTIGGQWVWNNATGFWEGVSELSGKMVVWHPSYAAAFTIR